MHKASPPCPPQKNKYACMGMGWPFGGHGLALPLHGLAFWGGMAGLAPTRNNYRKGKTNENGTLKVLKLAPGAFKPTVNCSFCPHWISNHIFFQYGDKTSPQGLYKHRGGSLDQKTTLLVSFQGSRSDMGPREPIELQTTG